VEFFAQVGQLRDGEMCARSRDSLMTVPLLQYASACVVISEQPGEAELEARLAGTFTGAGEFTVIGKCVTPGVVGTVFGLWNL
jgi:hypothetical protein